MGQVRVVLVVLVVLGWSDQTRGQGGLTPVVSTNYGQVQGRVETVPGTSQHINVFRGIPYAAPPVGARRFQKPEPPSPWPGVRAALQYGAACPQVYAPVSHTDEDCLFLNVYSPQLPTAASPVSSAVMVFIHGGAFVFGASQQYEAFSLAVHGVTVVTINYRLGALGFLSTEDDVIAGNYGMLDQVAALTWVKDNIAHFGGNASRVTIFGESAGADSVSLHLLSPLSRGLFQGAMMESGVSLCPWACGKAGDNPSPRDRAFALGSELGCKADNSSALLDCLLRVPAKVFPVTVVKAPKDYTLWYPVVETAFGFLPDLPATLIKAGDVAKVPTLRGTNTEESSTAVAEATPDIAAGVTRAELLAAIDTFVVDHFASNPNRTLITQALQQVYANPTNTSSKQATRASLIRMSSDFVFTAPTVRETQMYAALPGQPPVYMYLFGYRSSLDLLPPWMGVPHAAELYYVFGLAQVPGLRNYTAADAAFSRQVDSLWTNFAMYGNPTPQPVEGITWPAFTSGRQSYLSLGNTVEVGLDLRKEEMDLWNTLIPHLAGTQERQSGTDRLALQFKRLLRMVVAGTVRKRQNRL